MNDLLPEFTNPYSEWSIVAKELMCKNEDATLWDLIKVMYEYKTGCNMPEFPDEDEVIRYHISGMSKTEIANEVDSDTSTIDYILKENGFSPFRISPQVNVLDLENATGISNYIKEKCMREYKAWKKYCKGE